MSARRDIGRRGFVLLAVVLLVTIIAVVGATYARHVVLARHASPASLSALQRASATDAGLQYLRQWLRAGGDAASTVVSPDRAAVTLDLAALDADRSRFSLGSIDPQGIGSTLLVEVGRLPLVPGGSADELPRVRSELASALLADPATPLIWISVPTVITDADLAGIYVVGNGASLTLASVALDGCVVSAKTMNGSAYGSYSPVSAPTLLIAGDLRIRSGSHLPGVAIDMPDGVVSTTGTTAHLQIEGDVVAQVLLLSGSGSLAGNLATVSPPALGASVLRRGAGRVPLAWSSALDLGPCWDVASLAVVPRVHAPQDLPAILDFEFSGP